MGNSVLLIKNGMIYTGKERIDHGWLLIDEEGKISDIGTEQYETKQDSCVEIVDLGGGMIIPGLIDVHVHGGGGYDVMGASIQDLNGMSQFHAEKGTTSFLATTGVGSIEMIKEALLSIRKGFAEGIKGADLLGIHLEGPFINEKRNGAMPIRYIRRPDIEEMEDFIEASGSLIKLVTLAPEVKGGFELVKYLTSQGIKASIGHSDAVYEEVLEAVRLGSKHTTHHFNGMRPMHHREPGVAGSGLVLPELTTELIADGIHVHPAIIRILFDMKTEWNICAITDAVSYAGLMDGTYNDYTMKDGKIIITGTDTLAGSTLTMIQGLRNVISYTGRSLESVLPSFTLVPAKESGAEKYKGSLEIGKDADFLIVDEELEIHATYVKGKSVYKRS